MKENEIEESSDSCERQQKYILGFGFFLTGWEEVGGARMRKTTWNTQLYGRILLQY